MTYVFKTILDMSIGAGVLALLILIARGIIGRRLAIIMPVLCVLLIIKLLIPVSIQSPLSIQNLWASHTPQTAIESTETGILPTEPAEAATDPAGRIIDTDTAPAEAVSEITEEPAVQTVKPAWRPSLMDIAALIWAAGIAVLAVRTAAGNIRFLRMIRRNRPYGSPEFDALLDECAGACGIKKRIPAITASGVGAAAVYGAVKPRLLISPDMFDRLSDDEKRHVLLHEMSHIRSRDVLILLIATVVKIIHWFNPFVWIVFVLLRQDLEVACDAHVLDIIGPEHRHSYASTLVGLLKIPDARRLPPVTAVSMRKNNIKRRIVMIGRYKKRTLLYTVAACVLTVMIAVTGCTTAAGDTPAAQPDTTDVQEQSADDDVAAADADTMMGEYAFDYSAYADSPELSENIEKAVALLDGTTIAPKEQIDIMEVFLPINDAGGWKSAPGVIWNHDMYSWNADESNTYDTHTGGGIDLVVYTLSKAAAAARLDQSTNVGIDGEDFAAGGFAFANHTGTGAVIHADTTGTSIVVEIIEASSDQAAEETAAGDPELMASYTLDYNVHNLVNAFYNAEKAATLLNGAVIAPGQVLSLNEVLGPRTESAGWKAVPGISDSVYDMQIGGISAVSNALYNAAIRAELDVIESCCHTFPSAYVPGGLDATISTDGPDLKILNLYDIDVTIQCSFSDGIVTVDVYGPPRDYTVDFASELVSTGGTPETVYYYNTENTPDGQSIPEGQSVQYVSGVSGKTYNVYKTLYDLNGNEIETTLYRTCTYREQQGVAYINAPEPE